MTRRRRGSLVGDADDLALRMAMLSLLAGQPLTAGDITDAYPGLLTFTFHAGADRVELELRRLVSAGLVAQRTNPDALPAFEITTAGLDELQTWLSPAMTSVRQRTEPVFRTFLLQLMTRDEAMSFLKEVVAFNALRLHGLARLSRRQRAQHPLPLRPFVAIKAAVQRLEAQLAWAEWAENHVVGWPGANTHVATFDLPPPDGPHRRLDRLSAIQR